MGFVSAGVQGGGVFVSARTDANYLLDISKHAMQPIMHKNEAVSEGRARQDVRSACSQGRCVWCMYVQVWVEFGPIPSPLVREEQENVWLRLQLCLCCKTYRHYQEEAWPTHHRVKICTYCRFF